MCLALGGIVSLPVDDVESSEHRIISNHSSCLQESYDSGEGEDCGDIRIDWDGQIFARNFRLIHSNGDHENFSSNDDTWKTFHCNTALRSVSVEGVD